MKDYKFSFEVDGVSYPLIFNLNVMEDSQDKLGSVAKWGELTDAKSGEPNAKALKYGITAMINEAIDIENDEKGENRPFMTEKQVGRLITRAGLQKSAEALNNAVINATKDDNERNVYCTTASRNRLTQPIYCLSGVRCWVKKKKKSDE